MLRQLGTRVSPCGQLGPRALLALSTCSRAAEAASCSCSISITTSQAAVGASGAGASSQEATSQVWAARVLDSATASAYSAWPLHQQHGCQSSLSHQPSLLSGPAQHSGRWRSQSGWQVRCVDTTARKMPGRLRARSSPTPWQADIRTYRLTSGQLAKQQTGPFSQAAHANVSTTLLSPLAGTPRHSQRRQRSVTEPHPCTAHEHTAGGG